MIGGIEHSACSRSRSGPSSPMVSSTNSRCLGFQAFWELTFNIIQPSQLAHLPGSHGDPVWSPPHLSGRLQRVGGVSRVASDERLEPGGRQRNRSGWTCVVLGPVLFFLEGELSFWKKVHTQMDYLGRKMEVQCQIYTWGGVILIWMCGALYDTIRFS